MLCDSNCINSLECVLANHNLDVSVGDDGAEKGKQGVGATKGGLFKFVL